MFLALEKARFESFALGENGFAFGADIYRYADVVSLTLHQTHTTQYVYWTKSGTYDTAVMRIRMRDGNTLQLGFKESRLLAGHNNSKRAWIDRLLSVYVELANKTFQYRIEPYEGQLRELGFFLIGKTRFVPKEKLVVCKGHRFVVGEDSFLRSYGVIEPVPAHRPFLWRIVRSIAEEVFPFLIPRIPTLDNSDVIFWLLREHFGLTWSDKNET